MRAYCEGVRTVIGSLLAAARRVWRQTSGDPAPPAPSADCPMHGLMPCMPIPFARETDMADAVLAGAELLTVGATSLPFLEVSGARGVADVVFADFDTVAVTARRQAQAGPVPDLAALRCLLALAGGTPFDDLPIHAGVSRGHLVRAVLPRLADQGWLVRHGRSWEPRSSYRPVARSMVAVELKRDDWRGALRQASWHAESADLSWVVLDATRVLPALAAAEAFRHAGVGLASVASWPSGCTARHTAGVTVHIPPGPRDLPPRADSRALLAEQCLSLWLAGRSSGPDRHVFGQWLNAMPR